MSETERKAMTAPNFTELRRLAEAAVHAQAEFDRAKASGLVTVIGTMLGTEHWSLRVARTQHELWNAFDPATIVALLTALAAANARADAAEPDAARYQWLKTQYEPAKLHGGHVDAVSFCGVAKQ